MRKIGFNSQRDNFDFGGKFKGFQQCFSTSAWMLLSFFAPEKYRADDDKGLAVYVDDVSNIVGNPGIGEKEAKEHGIATTENTAYWWTVHQGAIEKWLSEAGIKGNAYFAECSWEDFEKHLADGPVIIGTNKLGGLPGGHIILAVDKLENGIIVNDPYGNAASEYSSKNGDSVLYPIEWLKQHVLPGQKVRCIYFIKSN